MELKSQKNIRLKKCLETIALVFVLTFCVRIRYSSWNLLRACVLWNDVWINLKVRTALNLTFSVRRTRIIIVAKYIYVFEYFREKKYRFDVILLRTRSVGRRFSSTRVHGIVRLNVRPMYSIRPPDRRF